MPITLAGPSPANLTSIAEQVATLVSQPQIAPRGTTRAAADLSTARSTRGRLGAAVPSALALAAPHPLFSATLADAADGAALTRAVHVGWRSLIQEDARTIGLADATVATEPAVTHVSEGPYGPSMARAITTAESLAQVAEKDYELRTLQLPALKVVALWLHGSDDLVIPLAPPGAGLEAGTVYTGDQLEQALRSAARIHAGFPAGAVG